MDIERALQEGRHAELIAHLRPQSDNGSADSSNNLAIVYRRMGQSENEVFFSHRAYEQDRSSSAAINTLLRALLTHGFYQVAARVYREVRNDRALNRIHHINGAIALIRINRVDEAGEALERAGGFPSNERADLRVEHLLARARFEHDRALVLLDRLAALGEDVEAQRTSQLFASGNMIGVVDHYDNMSTRHVGVRSQGKTALQAAIAIGDKDRVKKYMGLNPSVAPSTLALARGLLENRQFMEVLGSSRVYKFPFVATNFSVSLPQVMGGFYERQALDALRQFIRPGQTVVDVGANIGNHSVYFAGEAECKVIPFECNPRMIQNISDTININGLFDLVDLSHLGKAVSSSVGNIPFHFVRDDYSFVDTKNAEGAVLLPCLSLDSLKLNECALLKVDVDGGELGVLEGARETLSRLRPAVSIEVMNTNITSALEFFRSIDYEIFHEDSSNEAYSDFVFLPKVKQILNEL